MPTSEVQRHAAIGVALAAVAVVWIALGFVGIEPPLAFALLGSGADLIPPALLAAGVALVAPAAPEFVRARRGGAGTAAGQDARAQRTLPVRREQVSLAAWIVLRVLVVVTGLRALVTDGLIGDAARAITTPVASIVQTLVIALAVVLLLWVGSLALMAALRVNRAVKGGEAGLAEAGAGFGATVARWIAGLLTRVVGVVIGRGGAAVALFLLGVLGFVAYGGAGFRAVVAPNEAAVSRIPPSRFGDWLLATAEALLEAIKHGPRWAHFRLPAFGGFSFERGSSRVEGQQMRWVDEIVIARRWHKGVKSSVPGQAVEAHAETTKEKHWNAKKATQCGPHDLELMRLAEGMAATYVNHLNRYLGKVYATFELRISGWTNPVGGYHALIVKVAPEDAALSARKVIQDDLIFMLDMKTDYTATDLAKCLVFDDPRVANDPMRAGENGLFRGISYRNRADAPEDRQPHAPSWEPTGDVIRDAVSRALADGGDSRRFEFRGRVEDYDTVTYSFGLQLRERSGEQGGQFTDRAGVAAEAIKAWESDAFRQAVALYAHLRPADLVFSYDFASQLYVVRQSIEPPPFPGDLPNDPRVSLLRRVREIIAKPPAKPRSFQIGVGKRDRPLEIDFGYPNTPHALVAAQSGSGKSVSMLMAPALQLAAGNMPFDRAERGGLAIWLIDSTKRELSALLGDLPHIQRAVIAEDATDVLRVFDDLDAEIMRRQRTQPNYKWSAKSADPWFLVIVEEWQTLKENAVGDKEQEKAVEVIEARIAKGGALYRAAGANFVVATQTPTVDIVPSRIKNNLAVHIVGSTTPTSYDNLLGKRVNLGGIAGRMAITGTPNAPMGEPVIVHGFAELIGSADEEPGEKSDRGIRATVGEIVAHWGKRREPLVIEESGHLGGGSGIGSDGMDKPVSDDDEDPDAETVADAADDYVPGANDPAAMTAARFGPLEAARELFAWQLEYADGWLIFSAAELIARLRARYGKAPKDQVVRRAIGRLAELGVVRDVSVNGRPYRQLVQAVWPDVKELIETRTENDEPTDDRLFERRTAA